MIIFKNLARQKNFITLRKPLISRFFCIKKTELSENEFLKLWDDFYEDLTEQLEAETLSNKIEDFEETSEAVSIEC